MKKLTLIALPIASALLLSGAAMAHSGGVYSAPKVADSEITIDGKFDDPGWKKAPIETVAESKVAKWQKWGTYVFDEAPENDADASYSFSLAHSDNFLYIRIDVKDDSFNSEMEQAEYQNDTMELYFDGQNAGGERHENGVHVQMRVAPQTTIAPNGIGHLQKMDTGENAWEVHNYEPGTIGDTGKIFGTVGKDGWTIEMSIPWDELSYFIGDPAPTMGLDFQLNDNDEGGNVRQTQLFWSGGDGTNWQVPDNFGDLILVGRK